MESGRKALEERGNGKRDWTARSRVPRAGGLPELLASAEAGEIDAVIVESIDRLSRMTADATRIERELELMRHRPVRCRRADDRDATAILTRRVKQGVAEWYVRDLIEKSRRGMEESVRQGWHTGGAAPYGYMLEPHHHPNPQKAREAQEAPAHPRPGQGADRADDLRGLLRARPRPRRDLRQAQRDLDRYPPPRRNRKDENDLPPDLEQSHSSRSMLRNPKYTGYNVWGRHDKRRGRPLIRPRDQWVWSATPTHEAIVSRELFDAGRGTRRRNSDATKSAAAEALRPADAATAPAASTRCAGASAAASADGAWRAATRRAPTGTAASTSPDAAIAAADAAGHPRVLGIKEDIVLDAAARLPGRATFGPDRLRLLRAELAASTGGKARPADARARAPDGASKTKVDHALRRQALRLEEHDDPDAPCRQARQRSGSRN